MRLGVVLALLIAGECLTAFGGLWLAFEVKDVWDGWLSMAIFLAIIPATIWLGHRIFKLFER